jgi:hypothetical protein
VRRVAQATAIPVSITGSATPLRASRAWAGRAACAWAVIFALTSLSWEAVGLVGSDTLGVEIDRLAHERDASFVRELWPAFALKAFAAVLALALIQRRRLPRRLLLVLGGRRVPGALYTVANLVQYTLVITGAIGRPDALGTHAVRWHLARRTHSGSSAGCSSWSPLAPFRSRRRSACRAWVEAGYAL